MRIASLVLSVLLHPLVMPSLAAICYYNIFPSNAELPDGQMYWRILTALFSLTLVLPILSVLMMMRIGKISTVFMDDRRERNWPLVLTAIIYSGASYILHARVVPAFIQVFLLGAIMSMILAAMINLRWKISLHMIGIGGLCGGLTVLFFLAQEGHPLYLATVFCLAGILGTARMLLGAHNSLQILAGFILGFAVEFGLGMALSS